MRIDRVIIRAALSTLGAIALLLVVMVSALSIAFPQTMMKLSYDMGMDKLSVQFAARAYETSGKAYYVAYATEVAIGADDYTNVETYGELLVKDDEFADYCKERDVVVEENGAFQEISYAQYIYGEICVAKYLLGNTQQALQSAWEYIGNGTSFVKNNAMVALLLEMLGQKDLAAVQTVLGKMNEIEQSALADDTQRTYLSQLISATQNWTAKNS